MFLCTTIRPHSGRVKITWVSDALRDLYSLRDFKFCVKAI